MLPAVISRTLKTELGDVENATNHLIEVLRLDQRCVELGCVNSLHS
jgi:hypothetical protein